MRWEYKIVRNMLADTLEQSLNALGVDGWEVVSLAGVDGAFTLTGNRLYAVLKRQLAEVPRAAGLRGTAETNLALLADQAIADAVGTFTERRDAGDFVRLCDLVAARLVREGPAWELTGRAAQSRGALVATGRAAGWEEHSVRAVVASVVGPGSIGVGTPLLPASASADWRTLFPWLADEFSPATIEAAWAVAKGSLPSDEAGQALRDLCERVVAGAPAEVAWGRIRG